VKSLHNMMRITSCKRIVETEFASAPNPRRAKGADPLEAISRIEIATVKGALSNAGLRALSKLDGEVTFMRSRWLVAHLETDRAGTAALKLRRMAA